MGKCDLCDRMAELVPLYCHDTNPTDIDYLVCPRCRFRSVYGYYPEDEAKVLAQQEEIWSGMILDFDEMPYWQGKKVA